MQEVHLVPYDGKEDPGNPSYQVDTNFPQTPFEFANQGHADGPAELSGLHVFADSTAIFAAQGLEPVAHRFVPSVGTEKPDLQNGG